jgi:POT family proton-dependent oligopeptide transporter
MKPTSVEYESLEVTEIERSSLRRVCDDISIDMFLVAVAELAERFTYRSITAPMRKSKTCSIVWFKL